MDKQQWKDFGWAVAAFLADHPALRGGLIGFALGFLACLFL